MRKRSLWGFEGYFFSVSLHRATLDLYLCFRKSFLFSKLHRSAPWQIQNNRKSFRSKTRKFSAAEFTVFQMELCLSAIHLIISGNRSLFCQDFKKMRSESREETVFVIPKNYTHNPRARENKHNLTCYHRKKKEIMCLTGDYYDSV